MIELFSCAPLRASITPQQCGVNRLSIGSCVRCLGLGELVERFDGTECEKVVPRWNGHPKESRKVTLQRLAASAEDLVGEYTCIDLVDTPDAFSVTFEPVDMDQLDLMRRIERVAYEHGSTLGDEIMVRLQVFEAQL